jgi:hypothetical protein
MAPRRRRVREGKTRVPMTRVTGWNDRAPDATVRMPQDSAPGQAERGAGSTERGAGSTERACPTVLGAADDPQRADASLDIDVDPVLG